MSDQVIQGTDTAIINIPYVESWTLTQLRYACKNNKVKGYTKMNRAELENAVQGIINKMNSKKGEV